MAAENERLLRFSLQRHPHVARGIDVTLDRQAVELALEPLARFEPCWSPGNALRAVSIARQLAQFAKIRQYGLRISWQCRLPYQGREARGAETVRCLFGR